MRIKVSNAQISSKPAMVKFAKLQFMPSVLAATLFLCMIGIFSLVGAQTFPLNDRDEDNVVECCERGDVFCAVGQGQLQQRDPKTGALIRLLNSPSASEFNTGMCFDAVGNLHSTNFTNQSVTKFDTSSDPLASNNLCGAVIQHPFTVPFNLAPESCVFANSGNIFVGEADGFRRLQEFDGAGALQNVWNPSVGPRGMDWIDLDADQCTILHTSEGNLIRRFDTCSGVQLPNFADSSDGLVAPCYALRIRPNTPAGSLASGEVLVACASKVVRLDGNGTAIQAYVGATLSPPTSDLFALNLDPDGTSFWTATLNSGHVYRIDIAAGNQIKDFSCFPNTQMGGLAVCGELTVAVPHEICDNQIDDDGDGLVDSKDPDCPLVVVLKSFSAKVERLGVHLTWETIAETSTAGFRIVRERDGEGDVVLTSALIPARGDELRGAEYEYLDTSKQKRGEVRYYLEDLDLNGRATRHGPVVVELNRSVGTPDRGGPSR